MRQWAPRTRARVRDLLAAVEVLADAGADNFSRDDFTWLRELAREAIELRPLIANRSRAVRRLLEVSRSERKRIKAQLHSEETRRIRDEVMARSFGCCENCGRCVEGAIVMDHMLQGRGRRRQRQSAGTCWALCGPCNDMRTRNSPTAEYWRTKMRIFLKSRRLAVPKGLEP